MFLYPTLMSLSALYLLLCPYTHILNPIKHGVRQVAISWGGVQSARSLIGLSRDLIRPFHGHHTPLYSVGVYYGASRNKIFKKSWKKAEFSQFFSDNPIFGKNLKM